MSANPKLQSPKLNNLTKQITVLAKQDQGNANIGLILSRTLLRRIPKFTPINTIEELNTQLNQKIVHSTLFATIFCDYESHNSPIFILKNTAQALCNSSAYLFKIAEKYQSENVLKYSFLIELSYHLYSIAKAISVINPNLIHQQTIETTIDCIKSLNLTLKEQLLLNEEIQFLQNNSTYELRKKHILSKKDFLFDIDTNFPLKQDFTNYWHLIKNYYLQEQSRYLSNQLLFISKLPEFYRKPKTKQHNQIAHQSIQDSKNQERKQKIYLIPKQQTISDSSTLNQINSQILNLSCWLNAYQNNLSNQIADLYNYNDSPQSLTFCYLSYQQERNSHKNTIQNILDKIKQGKQYRIISYTVKSKINIFSLYKKILSQLIYFDLATAKILITYIKQSLFKKYHLKLPFFLIWLTLFFTLTIPIQEIILNHNQQYISTDQRISIYILEILTLLFLKYQFFSNLLKPIFNLQKIKKSSSKNKQKTKKLFLQLFQLYQYNSNKKIFLQIYNHNDINSNATEKLYNTIKKIKKIGNIDILFIQQQKSIIQNHTTSKILKLFDSTISLNDEESQNNNLTKNKPQIDSTQTSLNTSVFELNKPEQNILSQAIQAIPNKKSPQQIQQIYFKYILLKIIYYEHLTIQNTNPKITPQDWQNILQHIIQTRANANYQQHNQHKPVNNLQKLMQKIIIPNQFLSQLFNILR